MKDIINALKGKLLFVSLIIVLIIVSTASVTSLDDTMTVEANIIKSSGGGGGDDDIIRVEVPDNLFFGEVKIGEKSEELKVYVNNTGNVDITVTPKLTDSSEKIFSNLYFRKFKTSNGADVPFTKIGSFSFDITKPSSGKSFNDEYFYVLLDLTGYSETLNNNLIGHKADVKFYAVAK